jgi:phosphodiesterase/alkaline phosphatase D-like protein
MKILLSSLFLLSVYPLLANVPEIAGPISGDVRAKQVTLWMYAPVKSKCSVSYHAEGASGTDKKTGDLKPISDQAAKGMGQIFKSTVVGLLPNTDYHYHVSVDGKSKPDWKGSFKTAPVEGKSTAFRIAITSCMKIGRPQGSWDLLLAEQPDFHLTVGDTHYADTTNPTVQLKHHVSYRRVKSLPMCFARYRHMRSGTIMITDPNNSDGTAKGKEFSLAGWKQAWPNPASGTV